jgi:DNA-binding SARP family transcriptional activator
VGRGIESSGMLRARVLGALSLEVDGRPVRQIAGLKPRSVLAWLLLNPGPHARARVAARFWPDVLDTSARASLRSALWTIRGVLEQAGGDHYLVSDRESVGVTRELPLEVDAQEFWRLSSSDASPDLERALELMASPLLTDLADDWVLEARDDYASRAAAVALRLADEAEAAGDPRRAALRTRQALAHDRLSETTYRLLVRRLADAGERAQALSTLRRLETVLAAEFGTVPSAETQALAARLRAPPEKDRRPVASSAPRRPAGPLVGRDRERETLRSAWEAARAGSGAVALISGEGGIGKSRLAAELAELAGQGGATSITGAAPGLRGSPPFSLWLAVLDELVAGCPPPPAQAAWAAELARLCPAVELRWQRAAEPHAADHELARTRLFESVVEAIEWSTASGPVLIVLEDLHLADTASLTLLAHVGRRLANVRALIVATARPVTRDELVAALGALERGGALRTELHLQPLADPDIEVITEAVAPRLPPAARARVIAAAEGSPLLAREGARAVAAGADPAEGLRTWVRASRAKLETRARVLVDVAAVAARSLSLAEAVELLGGDRLPDALAEATAAGLLETAGATVGFGHELVRAACYAEIEPARRARLHARLGDLLSRRRRHQMAEVARHLLLAHQQERARSYVAAAAEKAVALGALDDAAELLREAAAVASDEVAQELWMSLAKVEARRGDRAAHDAAFERAVALLERAGDRAGLAHAHVVRGRLMRTALCYPREALSAYHTANEIVELEGIDAPELRALALAGSAWAEAVAGDPGRAEELLAAVERLPEARDDPALAAELALHSAMSLMRAGRLGESEQQSVAAARQARRAERVDLTRVALNTAASAAAARGDHEAALAHAEHATEAGRAGARLEVESHAARAYALSRLGRHGEALQAARLERAIARRSGSDEQEAIAAFDAGSVALAAAHGNDASTLLGAALDSDVSRLPRALARLRLADARLLADDVAGAAEEIERFPFEPVGPADVPATLVPQLDRLQGLIASARGNAELALRRLDDAEAGWRRMLRGNGLGEPLAATVVDLGRAPVAGLVEPAVGLGWVLADRALILAEQRRGDEARAAADEAARIAAELRFDGYRRVLERVDTTSAAYAGL